MEVIILCLTVFFARIIDMSMGTFRTIVMVRGKVVLASLIGFAEAFLWFTVVRNALTSDVGGIWVALAFAAGFSIGALVGGKLAGVLIGQVLAIQVVTKCLDLAEKLRKAGFAVTALNVETSEFTDEKRLLLMLEVRKKNQTDVEAIIKECDDSAFITIKETRLVQNGLLK
jgi:uncharacterized protein YebE (UPF0316 family)